MSGIQPAESPSKGDRRNSERRDLNHSSEVEVLRPAELGDGIISLADRLVELLSRYDDLKLRPDAFIPAEGRGSRMIAFLERYLRGNHSSEDLSELDRFIGGLRSESEGPEFAFRARLAEALARQDLELDRLIESRQYRIIVETILSQKGLGLRAIPKPLIPFHEYNGHISCPFEEQLLDAATCGVDQIIIQTEPEETELFKSALRRIEKQRAELQNQRIEWRLSDKQLHQLGHDAATGDLILDDQGEPVRFVPGHGVMIHRLNGLSRPVILRSAKNAPKSLAARKQIVDWTRVFTVLTADIKREIKSFFEAAENEMLSASALNNVLDRLQLLGLRPQLNYEQFRAGSNTKKQALLSRELMRPLRIVGVIEHTDVAGGKPLIIRHQGCEIVSLVERDELLPVQDRIWQDCRYFNPIQLVLDPADYQGRPIDLLPYINEQRRILVRRPYQGREVVYRELPGLWNGGMDGWNSVFVLIPRETFATAITLNNLLDPEHQEE